MLYPIVSNEPSVYQMNREGSEPDEKNSAHADRLTSHGSQRSSRKRKRMDACALHSTCARLSVLVCRH